MEILKTYDIKIGDLRRIYQDNCKGNKSLFENEIRKFFITKIQELPNDTVGIVSYLNTILVAVEEDLCATSTPFLLLQDSLDLLSKDKCNLIFTYIENNLNLWKKEPMHTAGKNYLLRMCNGLLKRLSPSQDTILCGRIQIFLAKLFLISDRSGLNLNGQFNIDNVTLYENKEEYDQFKNIRLSIIDNSNKYSSVNDEDLKKKIEDYNFYEKFWSIQNVFKDPIQCFINDNWTKFVEDTNEILKVFSTINSYQDKNNSNITSPIKNKPNIISNQNNKIINERNSKNIKDDLYDILNHFTSINNHKYDVGKTFKEIYFAKYLTGSNLLNMQLEDTHFRRCILLQYLFIFQFLTIESRFKTNLQTLDENKKKWISNTEKDILNILEDDHCTSKLKLKVQDILKYEEFWNDWKNNGCPNFTKIPPKLEMTEDVTKKSIESTESPPSKKLKRRYKKLYLDLGNPELNALWNYEPDNIKACASKNRIFKPSLQQFMAQNSSVDRLSNNPTDTDMDSSGDYLHLAKANNQFSDQTTREWKTLRLMSRECRHFFLPYFQGSSHHHNANNSQGPNTANVTGSSAANSTNSAKTTDISNKVVSDFIDKVSNKIKLEANKNKATSMITQNITTPILKDDFKASNIAKQASKVDTVGEGKEGNNLIKEIGTDQVMGQPDDNIDKTTSNHNEKAPESDRDMHSPNHSLSKRIKIENDDTNSNSIKKT
ncbi:THO complex subunit 1-like isoform X2 [Gordionus sp. m RMFG-2023]|uniref:THO complex subunit 1-like isoform X2 n=1 Tax=Gordionus sp. m RMFG-2023 TaxID=3053472 RepID=UPI0031FCD4AA